jgi:hypothetical protein
MVRSPTALEIGSGFAFSSPGCATNGSIEVGSQPISDELVDELLDRYSQTLDESALRSALEHLGQLIAAGPTVQRRYLRAWCQLQLAERLESIEWYDEGLAGLSAVLAEADRPVGEFSAEIVYWMEATWSRYRLAQDGGLRELDDLVADLERWPLTGASPSDAEVGHALRGLGRFSRFQQSLDPADLDRAIDELEAATAATPGRQHRDADARLILAAAWRSRWWLTGEPAHIDRAVECWWQMYENSPTAANVLDLAEVLCERAQRCARLDDLSEAILLLKRVGPNVTDWRVFSTLGTAFRLQWLQARTPSSLEEAERHQRAALALCGDDIDARMRVEQERCLAAIAMFDRDRHLDLPYPPSLPHLRKLLTECGDLVDAHPGAPAGIRMPLAGLTGRVALFVGSADFGAIDAARVLRWLELGRQAPDADEYHKALYDGLIGMLDAVMIGFTPNRSADEAISRLRTAAGSTVLDPDTRAAFQAMLPGLMGSNAQRRNDFTAAAGARQLLDQPTTIATTTEQAINLELLAIQAQLTHYLQQADHAGAAKVTERLERYLATVPPQYAARLRNDELVQLMRLTPTLLTGTGEPVAVGSPGAGGPVGWRALVLQAVTTAARFRQLAVADRAAARTLAAELASIAERIEPHELAQLATASLSSAAWLQLLQADRFDRDAAARAAHWFSVARHMLSGPGHLMWAATSIGWAESARALGDRRRSRELGLDALHGHLWRVLLQQRPAAAIQAARAAAADAAKVVAWCIEDQAYDDLLAVLDSGRGLVLRATTLSRTVAEELAARGAHRLADEWTQTAGLGHDQVTGSVLGRALLGGVEGPIEIPDDLRQRVMQVLGDELSTFEPHGRIGQAEVRRLLLAAETDALVYLLPAGASHGGIALIIHADGETRALPLEQLDAGPGSLVERWVAPRGTPLGRDVVALQPTAPGAPELDNVCRWAWTACIGPLIEAVHPINTGPARVVLVPTAALALVPWHAAFTGHEGERRYALEDLCISYGVSARGLRDTAAQSTSDSGPALVIGNPSGDLPFAGTEARAIHDAFHPRGTLLGDGEPVSPQDVLDWIATAPPGPLVLHFACHGAADPDSPADAHLVLSDGHWLTVRALIDASRLAALNIDRVFLAACTTNVIGSDHDEALSLSTAFLAAGAHTVFGSLWPVPDEHTSALMFMVHHYLYRSRLRPADALREAQRWMLNPHRAIPAEMPERLAATSRDGRIADPQAWAGFTHLGR